MATTPIVPTQPESASPCPCGSGKNFGHCCAPLIAGTQAAATAELLMRARFTAHVIRDYKFLHDTHRPTAGQPYVAEEGEPVMLWTKLVVHGHEITSDPDKSFVDFSAYGIDDGVEKVLQEKAEFLRINGTWLYSREARLGPAPYKAAAPKPGRNEPCPCGSGKKYKHCCLLKA